MDGQAVLGATIGDPWMYVAIISIGIIAFALRALVKGELRTGREVEQNNERLEYLEKALHTRDEQVGAALEVLPKIAGVLAELHPSQAVDQA